MRQPFPGKIETENCDGSGLLREARSTVASSLPDSERRPPELAAKAEI